MNNFNNGPIITKKIINLYLDNQLPEDQYSRVQQQATSDPRIIKIIRQEQDFRDFVKNSVKPVEVSSRVMDAVNQTIGRANQ